MRVRFNCPAAGRYRVVELIGTPSVPTAADDAANRCDPAIYPFPAPDNNPLTLPNLDGPVRFLPQGATFASFDVIEFWPDGTAHYRAGGGTNPWPMLSPTGLNLLVARKGKTATITVNGLGKISLLVN